MLILNSYFFVYKDANNGGSQPARTQQTQQIDRQEQTEAPADEPEEEPTESPQTEAPDEATDGNLVPGGEDA